MNVGDRVRYVGNTEGRTQSPHLKGSLGTVTVVHRQSANVRFGGDSFDYSLLKINLELLTMIDTTQPLDVGTNRPVTFVTETSEGHILVGMQAVNNFLEDGWMIFDKQGKFVRSSNDKGSGLTLRNTETKGEAFIVVGAKAWGGPNHDVFKKQPLGMPTQSIVRLITTNGLVTGVELVQSGNEPIQPR